MVQRMLPTSSFNSFISHIQNLTLIWALPSSHTSKVIQMKFHKKKLGSKINLYNYNQHEFFWHFEVCVCARARVLYI